MEGSALKDNIFFSSKLATTAGSKFTKAALFSHKLLMLVILCKTCFAIADSEDSYKKFFTTFITFLERGAKPEIFPPGKDCGPAQFCLCPLQHHQLKKQPMCKSSTKRLNGSE